MVLAANGGFQVNHTWYMLGSPSLPAKMLGSKEDK